MIQREYKKMTKCFKCNGRGYKEVFNKRNNKLEAIICKECKGTKHNEDEALLLFIRKFKSTRFKK